MKSNGKPNEISLNESSPVTASFTNSDEEKARRAQAAAERLAAQPAGAWRLWFEDAAAQIGIPPAKLEAMIKDILRDTEKKTREAKAEARREQAKAEKAAAEVKADRAKAKEAEFKALEQLPEAEQAPRIQEVARRLGEDPATITEEFASPLRARHRAKRSSPGQTRSRPRRFCLS